MVHLTYFATKNTTDAVEFYNIKDNISQLFHVGFQAKDRYIKINNITSITDGDDADIIYFTLTFEFFDTLGEDAIVDTSLTNVTISEYIKNGG